MILFITGFVIKIMGLVNRILLIRFIGNEGVLIYTLAFPTIMLFLSLAQFGLPITVSSLISKKNKSYTNYEIIKSSFIISLIISTILATILLLSIEQISVILNNQNIQGPLYLCVPLIFLVSFSGILKGYFNGINKVNITAFSNILEQIIRFSTSVALVYYFSQIDYVLAVSAAILSMAIGEFFSILFLMYKVKKQGSLKFKKYKKNSKIKRDILAISLPTTSSRLTGSITYFLEPIIYTIALSKLAYDSDIISNEFAALHGYAMPLLMTSSFISFAISQALIPEISSSFSTMQFKKLNNTLNKAIFFAFMPGLLVTILFITYPDEYLALLFNTSVGVKYVLILAPVFLLMYLQAIFTTTLQSIKKANDAFIGTLISCIIKLILIYVLTINPNINIYGIVIAQIASIIIATLLHFISMKKHTKYEIKVSKIVNYTLLSILLYLIVLNIKQYNYILVSIILSLIIGMIFAVKTKFLHFVLRSITRH